MQPSRTSTVLIVGAGPTGLTLACFLVQYGVAVKIIDKRLEPITTSNALAVHARTLEIFEQLGVVEHALQQGFQLHGVNLHAGKQTLAHIRFNTLQSCYPFVLGLPQHETEKILTEKLATLGVQVERGVECVDWQQNPEQVKVTLKQVDGDLETYKFNWFMDCAGSHDVIRKKLNLNTTGQNLPQQFIMADARLSSTLSTNELHAFFSPEGPLALIPFSKDYVRVLAEISHDTTLKSKTGISLADFDNIIAQRASVKMCLSDPVWISRFEVHSRFYAPYRHNRVFLLGDAAHHHSPVGGQGMNTGIQDAFNLAWKLALVIQGQAQPALLSSYAQEREPIGKTLVKSTAMMTRVVALNNHLLQAVRNKVFSLVAQRPKVRENIVNQLAELSVHYHHSPWVSDLASKQSGPKAGDRAPDGALTLATGETQRIYQLQQGLTHCLLLFPGANMDEKVTVAMQALQVWCTEHYQDVLDVVTIPAESDAVIAAYQATQACCYLIRPDLMIGFRSADFAIEPLKAYLEKILITHQSLQPD